MEIKSATKVFLCICLFLFTSILWSPVKCAQHCRWLKKCVCSPFGSKVFVKCKGIKQIPRGLPLATSMLDLSRNDLQFIPKEIFRNLFFLKIINLDDNKIEGGFYLPRTITKITMSNNRLSLGALKTILSNSKRVNFLNLFGNPIGPNLTADTFAGLQMMRDLYICNCSLKYIQSGTFRAMKNLKILNLWCNKLKTISADLLEGPGYKLSTLDLSTNELFSIPDGTFAYLSGLDTLTLGSNQLHSVPDLTGLDSLRFLMLHSNHIEDISRLGKSNISSVMTLSLAENEIEHLPVNILRNLVVFYTIDLSFNKLQSLPDKVFSSCSNLIELNLNFNSISQINSRTFAGLKNLRILMMTHNSLTFIPRYAFSDTLLKLLFLHSNAIKRVDGNAFAGLRNLKLVTLFGNTLGILPVKVFEEMSANTTVAVACKNLHQIPSGIYNALIECTPSSSFYVLFEDAGDSKKRSLFRSGFSCTECSFKEERTSVCSNCTFCMAGSYAGSQGSCIPCPAGGFYQSEMGEVSCKNCSTGTYVSEERHPGKTPTDCHACPYGTLSNETAGHRACKCLRGFYRMDRFGSCSECPAHGIKCVNDTAILAPNYYWKWPSEEEKLFYSNFLKNIYTLEPPYNKTFSRFQGTLPQPQKCPYPKACNGGVDSSCQDKFKGILCASCSINHYLRFNTCLECPRMVNTIISCVVVVLVFVAVFLVVLWGDSKRTENNRTVADVVMSCCKIVIGFYQVIAGIFSALVYVRWPVILISMEKYLNVVEGNILKFAPLSCIYSKLRPDPFLQFSLSVGINIFVVSLILLYLFLKKRHINNMEDSMSEKMIQISRLKKSCYRNIFLFLLLSYPVTSKKIIDILPLPGVCVNVCFSKSDCVSLLRADYSIHCFTSRHKIFWKIAAVFAFYPIAFPLMLLLPIYKYRQAETEKEIAFGLRVFFENYKEKYWFWETLEMYRKLLLISLILLFGSESHSQIGFTLVITSASGIAYTLFRPIKGKFEDRLQTFVLWITFFNVCLGSLYGQSDGRKKHVENDSIFINVLFLLLNSSVLIVAAVKGFLYLKSTWRKVSSCLKQCFYLVCHPWCGCSCGQQENAKEYILIQEED